MAGVRKALAEAGIAVRVVSMPCTSVFDRQPKAFYNTGTQGEK